MAENQNAMAAPVETPNEVKRPPVEQRFVEHYVTYIEPYAEIAGVSLRELGAALALARLEQPDLFKCTPQSLLRAVTRGLSLRMEIGREFYLVPFKERKRVRDDNGNWSEEVTLVCTGIPDYKEVAKLAVSTGAARSVEAACVYQNEIEQDRFIFRKGTNGGIDHNPMLDASKRGPLAGAYYVIQLPRYGVLFDFLPIADIEEVRMRSQQWGPKKFKECPPWWAKKRATIAGLKLVPQHPKFAPYYAALASGESAEVAQLEAPVVPFQDDDEPPRIAPQQQRALSEGTASSDDDVEFGAAEIADLGLDDAPIARGRRNAIAEGA